MTEPPTRIYTPQPSDRGRILELAGSDAPVRIYDPAVSR